MDTALTRPRRAPYNPKYDPMTDAEPGRGSDYAPTYWIATAGDPPEDDGILEGDIDVDVAIIGSGYTGLSCAIHLAKEYGIKAHVLEANSLAFGCSTRNGGQAQISSGRLKRSQWIERWGIETAQRMHHEVADAFDYFRSVIEDHQIDCDPRDGGHYYIAHRPSVMPSLEKEAALLRHSFGYGARMLGKNELRDRVVRDAEAEGAMWEPDGVCVHAAKLAFGYAKTARALGAKIHTGTPVLSWTNEGDRHRLHTPTGTVRARYVAVATAAYGQRSLHQRLRDRLLPILSNSIVTRPLTDAELEECGFKTFSPLTDTRTLRHYYRLLPDNRVQIGSRAAITGRDAANPRHLASLRDGLHRKFPALTGIHIDYSWWGWVDVSHDMMPRITAVPGTTGAFYSLGYGGNGVMYSAQAGRRMAQMVAGRSAEIPDLPIFQGELPHKGLLTPFRRLGQWGLYQFYHFRDERA